MRSQPFTTARTDPFSRRSSSHSWARAARRAGLASHWVERKAPFVINDTAVITLDIESRSHNYLVAIDGRSERMTEETRLIIRKAPHSIKIVKQRNQRYFSTLREKLMWGADQRER